MGEESGIAACISPASLASRTCIFLNGNPHLITPLLLSGEMKTCYYKARLLDCADYGGLGCPQTGAHPEAVVLGSHA